MFHLMLFCYYLFLDFVKKTTTLKCQNGVNIKAISLAL